VENKLTSKQEKFCQSIADGMNQTDAYKSAYSCKNQTEKTIWANASRLGDNSKVIARISELKAQIAKKQLWTREQSVEVLKKIAASTKAITKDSDRIAATRELNIMHGFNSNVDDLDSYIQPVKVTIQVKDARRSSERELAPG
jgi:phage terminase small subunit